MALSKKQRDFVDSVYAAARNAGMNHVQAAVTAAQAAQETGYGRSAPGNNFFGIKAGKSWKGPVNRLTTTEEVNGKKVKTKANFRAYANPIEGLKDRIAVMARAWPDFTKASTFKDAFSALQNGRWGAYATDSNYQPAVSGIIGSMGYWGGPPQTYGLSNSFGSLANVPTPTAAPRQGVLSAPVSPVDRAPLGLLGGPTVEGSYITGKPESFMPDVQQPASIAASVANNPESYTPAENRMIDNARYTAAGPIGIYEDKSLTNGLLASPSSLYGFGSQFTPAMQAALNPPEPAPAMTPARNVDSYNVASVTPSAPSVPSAQDFRAGLADWGVATDGTTFSRDALGRTVTTTPSGHSTVALDNGLTAAMWGAPAQSQGVQNTISAPKDIGLPSQNRMMDMGKNVAGSMAGGLLGNMLGGPMLGLLGAAIGKSVAQGKGLKGVLGNQKNTVSWQNTPNFSSNSFLSAPSAPAGGGDRGWTEGQLSALGDLSPGVAEATRGGAVGLW